MLELGHFHLNSLYYCDIKSDFKFICLASLPTWFGVMSSPRLWNQVCALVNKIIIYVKCNLISCVIKIYIYMKVFAGTDSVHKFFLRQKKHWETKVCFILESESGRGHQMGQTLCWQLPTEQRRVSSSLSLRASLQRLVAVCSLSPFPLFFAYFFHQLCCSLVPPSTQFFPFFHISYFFLLLLFFHPSHLFIPSAPPPPPLSLSLHLLFFKGVSARDRSCLHIQTSFCAFLKFLKGLEHPNDFTRLLRSLVSSFPSHSSSLCSSECDDVKITSQALFCDSPAAT